VEQNLNRAGDAAAWWLVAAMAVVCAFSCRGLAFTFAMPEGAIPMIGVAVLVAAMLIGKAQNRPSLAMGATAFLQMTLFTLIGVILSYALAARAGPLWDARFGAVDRALGFNWPVVFEVADRFGRALWLGGLAYHSLTLQMVICIVVLSATGQADRLRIAVTAAIASGFVTILISGMTPALGNVFNPEHYRHLWPSVAWTEQDMLAGLRDGSWRAIDLTQLMGIVTFPSYHATLPIILTWAVAKTRRWRVIAPVWAGITIIATPLFGGHYAIDVLAGAGLAVLALRLAPMIASSAPALPDPVGSGSLAELVRSDEMDAGARYAPREAQSGADNALV
jgi:hypothetical protein